MLSTIYLFKQEITTTEGTNDEISLALTIATSFIEKYLDRNLEYQLYRTWQNGKGGNSIILKEWPITRVYAISSIVTALAHVRVNDAANTDWVTVDISSTGVDGAFWYPDGEVPIDEYHNLTELIDDLNTQTDLEDNLLFSTSLIQDKYGDIPTMFLRPEALQLIKGSDSEIYGIFNDTPTSFTIDSGTNRVVHTNFLIPQGINNVFCWYSAGYVYPVDNVDHTGLDPSVTSTVPADLRSITHQVANDILQNVMTNSHTIISSGISGEKQGKYSYTRDTLSTDTLPYLTNQILKYETVLSKYRKLTLNV